MKALFCILLSFLYSCVQTFNVIGNSCEGKPDFSECNLGFLLAERNYPYTKCFNNKCEYHNCIGTLGHPCGNGAGICNRDFLCEPPNNQTEIDKNDISCKGKPDFAPCDQFCASKGKKFCSYPIVKCFNQKCESQCFGKADSAPCGNGAGKCRRFVCELT